MQVHQILKELQETMEDFGQITTVEMRPAGEFFRTDRIEISGKNTEGKKFELVLEIEEDCTKVSGND